MKKGSRAHDGLVKGTACAKALNKECAQYIQSPALKQPVSTLERRKGIAWRTREGLKVQGMGTWYGRMKGKWSLCPQLEPEVRRGTCRQAYTFSLMNSVLNDRPI